MVSLSLSLLLVLRILLILICLLHLLLRFMCLLLLIIIMIRLRLRLLLLLLLLCVCVCGRPHASEAKAGLSSPRVHTQGTRATHLPPPTPTNLSNVCVIFQTVWVRVDLCDRTTLH